MAEHQKGISDSSLVTGNMISAHMRVNQGADSVHWEASVFEAAISRPRCRYGLGTTEERE